MQRGSFASSSLLNRNAASPVVRAADTLSLTELDAQDSTRRTSAAYAARLGEVLALAPTNLAVRLLLVRALFDRGLTDSALVQLEEMQRAAPEPPAEARSVLADALQLLRDGKGAEARARALARLNSTPIPTDCEAWPGKRRARPPMRVGAPATRASPWPLRPGARR